MKINRYRDGGFKLTKSNRREIIIKLLVKDKFNSVVGGYENSVMDRIIDEIPPRKQLIEDIYDEVMTEDTIVTNMGVIYVKKDIRFMGRDKIIRCIEDKLDSEGL